MAHGSNVKDIETRAIYDEKEKEFILTTPSDKAIKLWIGNSANLANIGTIFAQLYVGEKCHGVHAFIVPLRSMNDHSLFPGVIIGDCGSKNGMVQLIDKLLIKKKI
jgi:acyl-CoA oxidase